MNLFTIPYANQAAAIKRARNMSEYRDEEIFIVEREGAKKKYILTNDAVSFQNVERLDTFKNGKRI